MPLGCNPQLGLAQPGGELEHLRSHLAQRRAVKRHRARVVRRGHLDEALQRVGELEAAVERDELRGAATDVRAADVAKAREQDVVEDLGAVKAQDAARDDGAEAAGEGDRGHRLCHARLDRSDAVGARERQRREGEQRDRHRARGLQALVDDGQGVDELGGRHRKSLP